jgi:hypothetical protein
MILKVILERKIFGDISVEYLGSISGKNLKGITREISGHYFWSIRLPIANANSGYSKIIFRLLGFAWQLAY